VSAPRRPVAYQIKPLARLWAVYSDAPAALPTGGLIVTGLDLRAARDLRDRWRKCKPPVAVECAELDAHS
jgi:hypothetical protein